MSNDSMGNLEKLGILVIVILVVVVGVVAITPSDTLFPKDGGVSVAGGDEDPERDGIPPLDIDSSRDGKTKFEGPSEIDRIPFWPEDEPEQGDGLVPDDRGAERDRFAERDLDHERQEDKIVALDPPNDVPLPPANEPRPIPVTPEPIRPVEPATRIVKVRSGDTIIGITQRELGSASRYKEVMALNPEVDPRRMREGQELRVPTGSAGSAEPTKKPGTRRTATGERTYVVQSGQTAGEISAAVYGTSKHWKRILDHNGIDDPTKVRAGATLRIPPLPTTSANAAPTGTRSTGTRSTGTRSTGTASAPERAAALATGRTYIVQPGETPGEIAAEQLGDYSRWRELLEFNGIKDENGLQAGATIRLPR